MAEHLRAVTLRGLALRQIMIFLRRKTQKGFFMEEKTKVTATPTIAEMCGIKYKEWMDCIIRFLESRSQRVMQVLENTDTVISEP